MAHQRNRRNALTDVAPMNAALQQVVIPSPVRLRPKARHSATQTATGGARSHRRDHPQGARRAGPGGARTVRVVVMGAGGVGKSCLVSRFLCDTFRDTHTPTVEDMHVGQRLAHGVRWNLEVLDTTGSFSFPAMRRLAEDTGDVFILVYSVNNEESFEEVRRLREEVLARHAETADHHPNRKTLIVVVGNKCDVTEGSRFMPSQTTDSLVNIEWGTYYMETSAKDGTNVEQAFTGLLWALVEDDSHKEFVDGLHHCLKHGLNCRERRKRSGVSGCLGFSCNTHDYLT